MEGLMIHKGAEKIQRQDLLALPVPEGTATHRPIAHHLIVEALIESLGFRRITPVREEYAVTKDGMRMFGVLDLNVEEKDIRFSIAVTKLPRQEFCNGPYLWLPCVLLRQSQFSWGIFPRDAQTYKVR